MREDTAWVTLTKRTLDPKLRCIEARLDAAGIKHRIIGRSLDAPIMEVETAKEREAWEILAPIDELPDDHQTFEDEVATINKNSPHIKNVETLCRYFGVEDTKFLATAVYARTQCGASIALVTMDENYDMREGMMLTPELVASQQIVSCVLSHPLEGYQDYSLQETLFFPFLWQDIHDAIARLDEAAERGFSDEDNLEEEEEIPPEVHDAINRMEKGKMKELMISYGFPAEEWSADELRETIRMNVLDETIPFEDILNNDAIARLEEAAENEEGEDGIPQEVHTAINRMDRDTMQQLMIDYGFPAELWSEDELRETLRENVVDGTIAIEVLESYT